jgi:hypothetical protein
MEEKRSNERETKEKERRGEKEKKGKIIKP